MKLPSTGRFTTALRKLVHYKHDVCSDCGRSLPRGVAAFAGYTLDGREVYVGECCSEKVDELASHIYWWWTSYKRPSPDTPLLRFMDFSKFMSLATEKRLFFARADTLGDPFEGARGIASKQEEWRAYTLNYYKEAIGNPPDGQAPPEDVIEREALRIQNEVEELSKKDIKRTYVSCWHSAQGESEALWRLYCPPGSSGVCIRTTFRDLDEAIRTEREVKFGHVQYIDFSKEFAGTYDRIFWKRKSLSHEAEVRGVLEDRRGEHEPPPGILIDVDLVKMIRQLIVSPFAPNWFQATLEKTMHKLTMPIHVVRSELSELPFY